MYIDEREVYISADGLGRAAIAVRPDGFYVVFVNWIWSSSTLESMNVKNSETDSWINFDVDAQKLYKYNEPVSGILESISDARNFISSLDGFEGAVKL